MPKKKGLFDTDLLIRAGQRGAGIAAGTIGGELVEDKLPLSNNKLKGLLLFSVGVGVSEFYNNNPIIGGLGAGLAAVGVRTAMKDNLQFLAGTEHVAQATIPEDYEIDDDDFLIEGVVEEIDDEIVEGVTEDIDDEVVEGATEDIDDEVLEGSDYDEYEDDDILLDEEDEDF